MKHLARAQDWSQAKRTVVGADELLELRAALAPRPQAQVDAGEHSIGDSGAAIIAFIVGTLSALPER